MRKRPLGARLAVLAAGVAALAVAAAGSATAKTATKASGSTTLKLVVADYGTGAEQHQQEVLARHRHGVRKQNPSIKVAITDIPWTHFDSEVQTMVQNKNYPDITEGDYFSAYAQQGLLYSAKPGAEQSKEPAAGVREPGLLQGQAVRHALDDELTHALLQQEALRPGRHQVRAEDLGECRGRRGQDQGARQDRLRPAARPGGGTG